MAASDDRVREPSDAEIERVQTLLRKVGGPQVQWGSKHILEVLLTERRIEAERVASARLTRATWTLALFTAALVLATVGLIYASYS